MEWAARGASEAGGTVIGILPGPDASEANPWVSIPLATNMGHGRNAIIAHSAEALVAIGGEYGTISEAAIALKLQKPVLALDPLVALPGMSVFREVEALLAALEATLAVSRGRS